MVKKNPSSQSVTTVKQIALVVKKISLNQRFALANPFLPRPKKNEQSELTSIELQFKKNLRKSVKSVASVFPKMSKAYQSQFLKPETSPKAKPNSMKRSEIKSETKKRPAITYESFRGVAENRTRVQTSNQIAFYTLIP